MLAIAATSFALRATFLLNRDDLSLALSHPLLGAEMRLTVEIDCTPQEARQFMDLPDVQPMQDAVMDMLEQQMVSNIEKGSPEALMQSWFLNTKITEQFQDIFVTMAG